MKSGQGFLLVFSLNSPSSLTEVTKLRDTIIRIKDDVSVPLVIVGNKCDLEEDLIVSPASRWGDAPYYETSARRRANVDEAFVDLCRQIIRKDVQRPVNIVNERPGIRPQRSSKEKKMRTSEGGEKRTKSMERKQCTIL